MPIEKPKKPTELVPRAFGGIKNNFSDDLQSTGFEPNIPQTYNGDNLNYHLDATGKELDYVEKVVDYINQMPVDSSLYVNSNNELDYINVGQFGNKADKDLANTGRITNCIIEIPQRIKLELNNGTLTLKAGSEVIVPNGFEADGTTPKFDYVTIENDSIRNATNTSTLSVMMFYSSSNGNFSNWSVKDCYSGTTAPTATYAVWYDTTRNKIYSTTNGGTNWTETKYSLPTCIATLTPSGFTSIDQVFNGFGYIGSTVWVDKDVKCLIPNGRNEDGTLNNDEVTINKLSTVSVNDTRNAYIVISSLGIGIPTTAEWRYDEQNNYNIQNGSPKQWATVGNMSMQTGVITSFSVKQPFRAVDYNDLDTKVNKAGDTMTGNLKITKNSTPVLDQQNTSDDRDVAPSKSAGTNYIRLTDKNNNAIAQFSNERLTNGTNTAKLQAVGKGGENAPAIRVHAFADGRQGCTFPMCTTKATTTSSARSDLIAVVTQNYVNGTSWYRVWSDGWIEQGGSVTVVATVTFLKPFSNANYAIVGTLTSGSTTHWEPVIIDNRTAKSCQINSSYSRTVSWYACGY